MNLKALKDQLNSLDTFGLDDSQVEVEIKTCMGGNLELTDIGLNIRVTPKVSTTVTLNVAHKPAPLNKMYGGR